jgi:hypothetical protein
MRPVPFLFCALLLLSASSCHRKAVDFAPVRGQVFYRGQPLSGGTIVFTPDPTRGGHGPLTCGEISSDGRYQLDPGAAPGWHRITVAAASRSLAPPLPSRYSDPEHSGQGIEIKTGQVNTHDLHLE